MVTTCIFVNYQVLSKIPSLWLAGTLSIRPLDDARMDGERHGWMDGETDRRMDTGLGLAVGCWARPIPTLGFIFPIYKMKLLD